VVREWFPNVPLMALTATATPRVRTDVLTILKMSAAVTFQSSFNRPNLFYEVRKKGKNVSALPLCPLAQWDPPACTRCLFSSRASPSRKWWRLCASIVGSPGLSTASAGRTQRPWPPASKLDGSCRAANVVHMRWLRVRPYHLGLGAQRLGVALPRRPGRGTANQGAREMDSRPRSSHLRHGSRLPRVWGEKWCQGARSRSFLIRSGRLPLAWASTSPMFGGSARPPWPNAWGSPAHRCMLATGDQLCDPRKPAQIDGGLLPRIRPGRPGWATQRLHPLLQLWRQSALHEHD
jgi:hypothetical protein